MLKGKKKEEETSLQKADLLPFDLTDTCSKRGQRIRSEKRRGGAFPRGGWRFSKQSGHTNLEQRLAERDGQEKEVHLTGEEAKWKRGSRVG